MSEDGSAGGYGGGGDTTGGMGGGGGNSPGQGGFNSGGGYANAGTGGGVSGGIGGLGNAGLGAGMGGGGGLGGGGQGNGGGLSGNSPAMAAGMAQNSDPFGIGSLFSALGPTTQQPSYAPAPAQAPTNSFTYSPATISSLGPPAASPMMSPGLDPYAGMAGMPPAGFISGIGPQSYGFDSTGPQASPYGAPPSFSPTQGPYSMGYVNALQDRGQMMSAPNDFSAPDGGMPSMAPPGFQPNAPANPYGTLNPNQSFASAPSPYGTLDPGAFNQTAMQQAMQARQSMMTGAYMGENQGYADPTAASPATMGMAPMGFQAGFDPSFSQYGPAPPPGIQTLSAPNMTPNTDPTTDNTTATTLNSLPNANQDPTGYGVPSIGAFNYSSYVKGMQSIEAGVAPDGSYVTNSAGYYGPAQFGQDTWAGVRTNNPDLGLPANMHDATPEQYSAATQALTAENVNALQRAGLPVNNATAYLAHQAGIGETIGALSMGMNAPVSAAFSEANVTSNPAVYAGAKTVGDVIGNINNKMAAAGAAPSSATSDASLGGFGPGESPSPPGNIATASFRDTSNTDPTNVGKNPAGIGPDAREVFLPLPSPALGSNADPTAVASTAQALAPAAAMGAGTIFADLPGLTITPSTNPVDQSTFTAPTISALPGNNADPTTSGNYSPLGTAVGIASGLAGALSQAPQAPAPVAPQAPAGLVGGGAPAPAPVQNFLGGGVALQPGAQAPAPSVPTPAPASVGQSPGPASLLPAASPIPLTAANAAGTIFADLPGLAQSAPSTPGGAAAASVGGLDAAGTIFSDLPGLAVDAPTTPAAAQAVAATQAAERLAADGTPTPPQRPNELSGYSIGERPVDATDQSFQQGHPIASVPTISPAWESIKQNLVRGFGPEPMATPQEQDDPLAAGEAGADRQGAQAIAAGIVRGIKAGQEGLSNAAVIAGEKLGVFKPEEREANTRQASTLVDILQAESMGRGAPAAKPDGAGVFDDLPPADTVRPLNIRGQAETEAPLSSTERHAAGLEPQMNRAPAPASTGQAAPEVPPQTRGAAAGGADVVTRPWIDGDQQAAKLEQNRAQQPAQPASPGVKKAIKEAGGWFQKVLAPETRGAGRDAASSIRQKIGTATRDTERAAAAFTHVQQQTARMSDAERLDVIDFIERHQDYLRKGSEPAEEIRPILESVRSVLDERKAKLAASPQTEKMNFLEDYFPHMWEDQAAAKQFAQNWMSSREGSGKATKQRVLPTISDGIQAGLVPKSTDPLAATMSYVHNIDRFVATNEVFDEGLSQGNIISRFPGQQPKGWVELASRKNLKQGEKFYAPEDYARVYNNFTSRADGLTGDALRTVIMGTNAVTGMKLSLSGFHALNMMGEGIVSGVADAIDTLSGGAPISAAKKLATAPLRPVTGYMTGKQLAKAYLHGTGSPEMLRAAELAADSNFRVIGKGRGADEYRFSHLGSYFEAYKRGSLKAELMAKDTSRGPMLGAAHAMYQALGRTMDTVMDPLFKTYIPMVKNGAYFHTLNTWLEKHPMASPAEQVAAARRIGDLIDDSFGEMNHDNIFWDKTMKLTAQAATISFSYELGTARMAGKAARDAAQKIRHPFTAEWTPAMSRAVAIPVVAVAMNSVAQYLMTATNNGKGEFPQDLRDVMHPRTGKKDATSGQPERMVLPSYMNQFYNAAHDFAGEIEGKVNPLWPILKHIATGTDWRGDEFAPSTDPKLKMLGEWFKFVGKEVAPISLGTEHKRGSGLGPVAAAAGIRPAPMWATDPARDEFWKGKMQQKADRNKRRHDAAHARDYGPETPVAPNFGGRDLTIYRGSLQ